MADNLSTEWPTDAELSASNDVVNAQLARQGKVLGPGGVDSISAGGTQQADIEKLFNPARNALENALAEAKKAQGIREKEAEDIEKGAAERRRLATDEASVPLPDELKLQDIPSEPTDKSQPPINAFGSILGALAMLSGALGRRPAIDAMRAFSGVIKGANQGNQQERDYSLKLYQANIQRVHAQNAKAATEYNSILKRAELSVDQKHAYLEAAVAANQDTVAADELRAKGVDGIVALQEKRSELLSKMGDSEAKATMQVYGFGNTDGWVDAVGTYRMPYPTSQFFLRSPQGAQFLSALAQKYPNYKTDLYNTITAVQKDYSQAGPTGRQIQSAKTVLAHIDDVWYPMAQALDNGNFVAFNAMRQAANKQLGMAIPSNVDAASIFVGDELTKALLNSSAGGVTDRDKAQAIFDKAKSNGQLTGAVQTIGGLLYERIESLKGTYEANLHDQPQHPDFESFTGTQGLEEKLKKIGGGQNAGQIQAALQAIGVPYEPDKYDYQISDDGKVQRRLKGQ